MEPEKIEFSFEYVVLGKSGLTRIVVHLQGATFTDKFDVTDAYRRERFLKRLLKRYSGISLENAERELDRIAGEVAEHAKQASEEGEETCEDKPDTELLTDIATDKHEVELFHVGSRHDAEGCATIKIDGHLETWLIESSGFKHWLRRRFYEIYKRAPVAQSFTDAINLIVSIAIFDGTERKVFVRLAEYDGAIWLDLGDDTWRAVRITATGWEIVDGDKVPVRFLRRRGMLPLPVPVRGGSIVELRRFVNMPTDELWILFAGSLPSLFRPRGPFAVFVFSGPQGSGKSSAVRRLRDLVDPNKSPLRRLPHDERDLMIAAQNSFVLVFDNLSSIFPGISDALCCIATGGGFSTRQLYSDDEEKLFDSMRPVVLNGIEDVATRADLLDRSALFNLPAMKEENLKEEADLDREFQEARPRIIGALLDAVAEALRRFDSVRLDRKPRMMDFAKWCSAAETAFGWKEGTFLAAYMRNRGDAQAIAIESSAVGLPLIALMEDRSSWQGSARELLEVLENAHTDPQTRDRKDWPKTPKGMSDALKRIAPTLRAYGINVEIGKRKPGGKRERQIVLTKLAPGTDPGTDGDSGASANRPGENDSGSVPEGGRDGRDGWDIHSPTEPDTAADSGEGTASHQTEKGVGTARNSLDETALEQLGGRPSQTSQPSRDGLGGPENTVSPGQSRDGDSDPGTFIFPESSSSAAPDSQPDDDDWGVL